MAETPTDVLVGAYPDIDAAMDDFDALAKLVEEQASRDGGGDPDHARRRRLGDGGADRRPPRAQGCRVGRRRGRPRRSGRAAAARGHRGGRGRGRPGREVRRQAARDRDARQDRREPAGRDGRDHRRVRRLAAARGRAGASGRAREVDRPDGQEGPEGAQGRSRGGDGQVRPRPHRAADPRPELRRDDRADDRPVGPRLDDHSGPEGAAGRPERPAHPHRRRRVRAARHVRRAGGHPEPDPRREDGPHLQPLPRGRALLADEGVDAHGTQPASRRHGLGRGVPGARSRGTPAPCRAAACRSRGC